jgi:hypothetical protein
MLLLGQRGAYTLGVHYIRSPSILIAVDQQRVPPGCLDEIQTWDLPYSRQVLTNELRHIPIDLRHTPMELEWNSGFGNWLIIDWDKCLCGVCFWVTFILQVE